MVADGEAEDGSDGLVESFALGCGNAVGGCRGVQTGAVQSLIGVDVAEAGDDGLVEEQRFQLSAALLEDCSERCRCEVARQRLGAEVGGGDGEIMRMRDASELPRVAEVKLFAGRESPS